MKINKDDTHQWSGPFGTATMDLYDGLLCQTCRCSYRDASLYGIKCGETMTIRTWIKKWLSLYFGKFPK